MSPDLKPEGDIILEEMFGSTRHIVTRLPSGAIVDTCINPQEKPPQKSKSDASNHGFPSFASAGINEQRKRVAKRHRRG